jgi:hypothetical protein
VSRDGDSFFAIIAAGNYSEHVVGDASDSSLRCGAFNEESVHEGLGKVSSQLTLLDVELLGK